MTLPQNQARRKILVDADGLDYVKKEIAELHDKYQVQLGASGHGSGSVHDESLRQKINLLDKISNLLDTELKIEAIETV